MTSSRFNALALISALGATTPAAAQGLFSYDPAEPGFYVSGFVGFGETGDTTYSGVQNPAAGAPGVAGAPARVEAEFDSDVNFGGAVGYRLPFKYWTYFQPRLELEVSAITGAEVAGGSFNDGAQVFQGEQDIVFFLINNYSDIRWSDTQTIVPYVGGGLGVGQVDADILYAGGGAPAPNFGVVGDDTGFVSTLAAGLTLETSERVELYGEARYFQIRDIELERRFIADGADLFNAEVDDDVDGFTFTVGARLNF